MCGKVTQDHAWSEIVEYSRVVSRGEGGDNDTVTPMRMANILHLDVAGTRRKTRMRWGIQRKGATSPRPDFIHAKAETVDKLPTFSDAFEHRRGLLVVNSFNEGEQVGSKVVQHVITPNDGQPLAIAVIWGMTPIEGGELPCFVMITVPANTLIASITKRMPAMIQPADWPLWLGESWAPPEEVQQRLVTTEGDWSMKQQQRAPRPSRGSPALPV